MMPTMTTPDPGVYTGVPMEEYHSWNLVSSSRLGKLKRSPAHLRSYLDLPQAPDTPALAFGRAAHTAILEPDQFDVRYVETEQCKATTTKGVRCSKAGIVPLLGGGFVCSVHGNVGTPDHSRELLSPQDRRHCVGMRDSIRSLARAQALLDGLAAVEVSVVWNDPDTGLACKARWDGHTTLADGCILDLKSTVDASRQEFEKSIFRYGYHRQGALYLEAARAQDIPVKHYVIIAVEKEPPYAAAIYRLQEDAIAFGSDEVLRLRRQYAECVRSGEWPGYGDDVQDIGLPAWAYSQGDVR